MLVLFCYLISVLLISIQITAFCLKGLLGRTATGHPYGQLYKENEAPAKSAKEEKCPAKAMETGTSVSFQKCWLSDVTQEESAEEMKTAARKEVVLVPLKTPSERRQDARWKKIQDKAAGRKRTKGKEDNSSEEEMDAEDMDDTMAGVVSLPMDAATSALCRRNPHVQRSDENLSILRLE